MTYDVPELLLVGAAQSLVLGQSVLNGETKDDRPECNDSVDEGANHYEDELAW